MRVRHKGKWELRARTRKESSKCAATPTWLVVSGRCSRLVALVCLLSSLSRFNYPQITASYSRLGLVPDQPPRLQDNHVTVKWGHDAYSRTAHREIRYKEVF